MVSRPFGTVTFLMSDIEGSTRRWADQPDSMRAALARHDDVMADAVESNGGGCSNIPATELLRHLAGRELPSTLRSADTERATVPAAGDAERPLSDAWRKQHGA